MTTALLDRSSAARLELRGADRQRFLNGLVTCDTKTLKPGHGVYGFFTDGKGRVLADVVVLALEDRLWLELPAGQGDAIARHLQKYIIADRVDVEPAERASPGQQHTGRGEPVTTGMRALPDPSGGPLVTGQRDGTAADRAADVVPPVGADEEDRLSS